MEANDIKCNVTNEILIENESAASILSDIESNKNVIIVTDGDGNQQIVGSLISNEDLQNGTENVYILNDSQLLESKNKQIITIDGNVLIADNQLVTTENFSAEQVQILNENVSKENKDETDEEVPEDADIEQVLNNEFNKITKRLAYVEQILNKFENQGAHLNQKLNSLYSSLLKAGCKSSDNDIFPAESTSPKSSVSVSKLPNKLTAEEDYPDGSWLGDPNNPDKRIRCNISPMNLHNINETSKTAEKMAVTLLDYLFDRETQSISNISGTSKHGKRQLNPVFIYGIKCHIEYHYGTSEKDWIRIKANLDSKCRTAFKRKMKGMSLSVKSSKSSHDVLPTNEISCEPDHYVTYQDLDFDSELIVDHSNIAADAIQHITESSSASNGISIPVSGSDSRIIRIYR